MAEGRAVGTMFVELSMDATKYTKAQKDILAGAEKNSADINKVFKTVGTQSDAMYDAMRKNIQNALGAIKQSHLSSKDEIVRAETAAATKIQSLNEQQFGKQTSFIDKLKSNWMGMAAVATAAYMIVKNVVAEPIAAYMESEKALMKLGLAMKNQGDYSRTALDDMVQFSEQMQRTTAVEDDLAKSVMGTLKSFGMTNEEVKKATMAAADMAAFTGKSIETTSDLLGKAYAGNTAALSRYGIVVDENIPKSEKFAAVMAQLEQRFGGAAQAELLTYAGQWQQMKNVWGDVQEFLGLVFLKTLEAIMFTMSMVGAGFWKVVQGMLTGIGWLTDKLAAFANFVGLEKVSSGLGAITEGLKAGATNAEEAAAAATKSAIANYNNMMSFDNVGKAIDNMGKAGKRTMAINEEASKAAAESAKKVLEAAKAIGAEITKEDKRRFDETVKQIHDEYDVYIKAEKAKADWHEKMAREAVEDTIKAIGDEYDIYLKGENDKKKLAEDRVKMERDIYKDIRGFSQQSYAASISLIATQADAYRAAGVDAVAVAEWVKQETIKAKIAEGKESKFFFDGVRAGLLEMKQNAMTWGQAGYDIFKTFASSSQTAISTILFDGFKGELKSFGDYFSAFWDSMLQTFVNILAQMLTEYALAQAAMGAIKIGGIVGGTTGGVIADVATSVLTKIGAGAVTTGAATAAGGGGASVVTGASTVAGVAGVGTAAGAGGAGGAAGAGAAGTGAMAAAGTAVAVVGAIFAVGKLMEHFLREPGRPWSDVSDQELLAKVPGFYARLQKEEFSPFTSAGPDYEQEELEDTDERMIATQWLTEYTRRHGRPYDPVKGYAMGGILSHASLVVAGEAGPEAIMPLKRGASGQLGVVAAGMGGRDESAALLQAVLDKLLDIIDRYDQWDGRGLLTRTS